MKIYKNLKSYCCEDISLIENYDKMINDTDNKWVCHHRLEIQEDKVFTPKELKELGLYYHRPASELIFLTRGEHASLHHNGVSRPQEVIEKMSKAQKGRTFSEEHRRKMKEAWVRRRQRPFSEETRKKISQSLLGNKRTLGYKHTEETRKKMSESQRKRRQQSNLL